MSNRKMLLCMLITVSTLLLLLIIALAIAYFMKVLIIRLPSSWSAKKTPYHPFTLNPLWDHTVQPYPPLPYPNYPPVPYRPAIPTLPLPTDQLRSQIFLCQMYILDQANKAYTNHNHYEYREASQMILNAVESELKQSSLQPYLENVKVWDLRNRGSDLIVDYSISLLAPTLGHISATAVKNVLLSILPRIEAHLNDSHIERSSISVRYLQLNNG